MKKTLLMIGICMIFVSMTLGCGFFGGSQNETKLTVEQGMGVIGTLKVDELSPGLDGYLSLTVRNNLGGESASKVYVSLDNVEPFKIFECGTFHNDSTEKRSCSGEFSLDSALPYRMHGESKMFPGQELEFFWRLKAPSKDEISNIALKHPMYYDLEYDYKTTFVQNIIFMSQQEVLRRRQAGESYQVEGEANSGAGELRVTGSTPQPVIYFFQDPNNIKTSENDFAFPLRYSVQNQGKGLPLSDVIVLVEIPRGKFSSSMDIVPDTSSMKDYGWQKFSQLDKTCGYYCAAGSTGRCDIAVERVASCTDVGCKNTCLGTGASCSEINKDVCVGANNRFADIPTKTEFTGDSMCNTGLGEKSCSSWIQETYGNDFSTYFSKPIAEDRLLVKIVKRTDFINEFSLYIPLKLVGGDSTHGMTALKNLQIPIEIYGFKIHNMYRYFTEGSSEITVYPVRV